jgi:hypothetical protein
MMRYLIFVLLLILPEVCRAQTEKIKDQYLSLSISQLKESLNYGFVYNGPQFRYGRNWQWINPGNEYELQTSLGFSTLFKKGIGIDFHLSPVNFKFLFNINQNLWIGPEFLSDYYYDFYPDMQAGHDYWFSHYSGGVSFLYQKPFEKRILTIKLSNSLFGFTSRTPEDYNTLFFDIGFKDALLHLNRKLRWNKINQYNISRLEIKLSPLNIRRVDFSFCMDYIAFYQSARWTRVDYGIKLTIRSKPHINS